MNPLSYLRSVLGFMNNSLWTPDQFFQIKQEVLTLFFDVGKERVVEDRILDVD